MDLHKIISELQSEKLRLDEAIQALERLSTAPAAGRKRGRPSKSPPGTASSEEAREISKAQGKS